MGISNISANILSLAQCCGAGAESRGAEIKLPPGAGAEIMNRGFGSFLFEEILLKQTYLMLVYL